MLLSYSKNVLSFNLRLIIYFLNAFIFVQYTHKHTIHATLANASPT